jgi:trk system potassium uptake protein TrkH
MPTATRVRTFDDSQDFHQTAASNEFVSSAVCLGGRAGSAAGTRRRFPARPPLTGELDTLSYAARPRVIGKYLGQTGLVLAALQLPPMAVALGTGGYAVGLTELGVGAGLALACAPLVRLPAPERTLPGEALAVVSLTFILAALLLWLPFLAGGLRGVDALFEAVSAVTTTGLSTVTSVQDLPVSLVFLRSWAQWYGGLGIVVFAIALVMQQPAMMRRLIGTAQTGRPDTTARAYARRVSITYAVLTLGALGLLWAMGAGPLPGAVHALSGISTGGFSSFDAGLAGFDSPALWTAVAIIGLCGAVSLPLYSELWARNWRAFFGDAELLGLLGVLLLVWALLAASLYASGQSAPTAGGNAALLAVFAQSTTGYSTVDPALLSPFAKLVLIVSMTVGGSMGSTAGGIKVLRLLLFLRFAQTTIRRLRLPEHAMRQFRLANRRYEEPELLGALFYVLLFLVVVLVSWLAFVAAGHGTLDSLFEVTSAMGTVGLSTGLTQPGLDVPLKLVLVFDMLAGRLEILAVLVLAHPGLWLGRRVENL